MEERRGINRVAYKANSIVVVCDTQQSFQAQVENVSPLGMGVLVPVDTPELLGKDIIIVAETLIMYADVNRVEKREDGTSFIGISAKKFTPEVLQFLFDRIQE